MATMSDESREEEQEQEEEQEEEQEDGEIEVQEQEQPSTTLTHGITKHRRTRSGTTALRQIRSLQKSVGSVLQRAPFRREVRAMFVTQVQELCKQRQLDFLDCCQACKRAGGLQTEDEIRKFEVKYRSRFGYPPLTADEKVSYPIGDPSGHCAPWCKVTHMNTPAIDAVMNSLESTMNDMFTTAQIYAFQAGRITIKKHDLELYKATHPNVAMAVDCHSLIQRCPKFRLRQRTSTSATARRQAQKRLQKKHAQLVTVPEAEGE
jgi:histone H3/H4